MLTRMAIRNPSSRRARKLRDVFRPPAIALGSYGFDTKKAAAELRQIADVVVERALLVLAEIEAMARGISRSGGFGRRPAAAVRRASKP